MQLAETTPLFALQSALNNASMSMRDGAADAPISGRQMGRNSAVRKNNTKTRKERKAVANMAAELADLRTMTVAQLRERFRAVFDEPSRSRNKDYLCKKVAWRIQELAEGGLTERARDRLAELDQAPARRRSRSTVRSAAREGSDPVGLQTARDPRLPGPGTVLTRVHRDVEHKVTVLDEGFEFEGTRFASLSKVAREITGTNWNGFLFFGLQRRTRKAGTEISA